MGKVIATYTVRPAQETPNEHRLVSDCDQVRAMTHTPTVYFYSPTDVSLESAAEILRQSLSVALVAFYPLAGRLNWIGGGRVELDCNALGAPLIAVESEAKIEDFGDFRPIPEIQALIPSVDYKRPIHELPLLLAQVTKFSCGGLSLGLAISHVLVDGQAALHFVGEWCKIARGEQGSSRPPFLDRSVLLAPQHLTAPVFDHPEYHPLPHLIGKQDEVEEQNRETDTLLLRLSKDQVEKVKEKANKNQAAASDNKRPYTRFEAIAGHIWKTTCKARQHETQQPTTLCTFVDARNRMRPPLPPSYFGNAIFRVTAESTSGEIVSNPLGYASGKAREAIEKATHEYLESSLVYPKCQEHVTRFGNVHTAGNPNIDITSWGRLPLYGADFGCGEEVYMGPGSIDFDGKGYILPGKGLDGSISVAMRLQVRHIQAFKKFFYQDL